MISELPLILKPALAIDSLKGGDSHNEIIKKSRGDFNEAAILIIGPSLIYDEVFVGSLHIVCVEDDLTEVYVGDEYLTF